MTPSTTPPRSVCVVMLSAIGDAIHVQPVISALKRAWPQTHLTWISQRIPMQVGIHHPDVDRFIVYHRRRGAASWTSFAELARETKEMRFDLVLALQVYLKAGVITALLNSPRKLGFDRARARDLNWLFTNERIPVHPVQHVQDQYFEFLHHLGVDPFPVDWKLTFTDAEREAQRCFFRTVERPACAVVLGTSKREKNWNPKSYTAVVDDLYHTHGLQPILVGGPSPAERDAAEIIKRTASCTPTDMLGDDVRRVMWLTDGCALMVAPDTGPLHIARALGVPVVGLYGFTNPKRGGPYRLFTDLVVDGYACFPGEAYAPSPEYRDGMKRVTVEGVLEKVELAMERYVRPTGEATS